MFSHWLILYGYKIIEEERRLMYVAITRAEDHLFFSYAHSRMTWWQTKMNPPSRFLDEISQDLMKKYDLWWWSSLTEEQSRVDEWDIVRHKLFWTWYVLEVWKWLAIVKFHNPKFGVRKIEQRFLQIYLIVENIRYNLSLFFVLSIFK
jgi:hypothetical protein